MDVIIQNAKVIDPKNKTNAVLDLYIKRGKIAELKKDIQAKDVPVLDAKNLCLIPGLIDLHVHFREPGYEQKETITTGALAALKGGVVAAVTMPNTDPPCDHHSVVDNIIRKAREVPFHIFPAGTISQGRAGKYLSEMVDLKRAGIWAVSDDGDWVGDSLLMRRALDYASMLDLLVITHAEDHRLSADGVMTEGLVSTKLGLRAKPNASEDVAVARDIELARLTGARLHIAHISTRGALDFVRRAKSQGLLVTCEVTPHHFALSDEALVRYDTNFKMNPPLRSEEDRKAMVEGLKDGSIDAIATDHAPHTQEEKMLEIDHAPCGVLGVETSFGVAMTELYHKKVLSFEEIIHKMSVRPAEILKLPAQFGQIRVGDKANVTLVAPDHEWVVDPAKFASKSKNSCFIGQKLKGKVMATVCDGKLWQWEKIS
ncbi:MAG: dihydroorotase [Candidatus Omnitrophica bacterium CG11_big_fil_rev_8_21_14_0_20_45_26]|uniref:Dihydroorotase n=1 Tax=Candidatus Abzuiibacterium crystallinum TaxID=1974748 RepID=A0A2H0LNW6_9BACT|nr:MAG: dihydroorotase [Candidatus Omnitrophica bacterium CG11_big_fil_rev_8_21_14_0_20_45_26]PIW65673.1 MAG: dihydroorotase [Candidatus Omnitrophica bacterium CG12_big_fil_rev_8_21_14_0_65_45_16]